ncbi:hypothetical protein MKW98_023557 [Papaver atlanticum]|uniref:Desiccation-related protein PCC13-62 n=1 Tax=Papaver atlanticum TaxID=357466 RepID=A0AAD4SYI8_9MAGN|nr:hypothetical protein MKW98_023557 [Papaver atlanticum]
MDTSFSSFFLSALFMLMFPVMNSAGFPPTLEPICGPTHPPDAIPIYPNDVHLLQFPLNLEHLEADYFLYGALGYGPYKVAPELVMGGPPPIGAQKANLDELVNRIIEEFGYQEVDLLLLAGLLGVEAGQDAVIRMYLYERADYKVYPYDYTVAEFTDCISELRNKLGICGIKDEGICVPLNLGAENRTTSNVLAADYNSLSYARTPREILRIVYGTGSEHVPGGFFPKGENGKIARELLYSYE